MLKRLSLRNFKAFKKLDLEFADITILIGPQGVGKSSVLDALHLLAQSSGQPQLNLRSGRFRGLTFTDLVYKRDERESIEFGLSLEFIGAYPFVTQGPTHKVDYWLVIDSNGYREQRTEYIFPERQWKIVTPRQPAQWWIAPAPIEGMEGKVVLQRSPLILIPFNFALNERIGPLHWSLRALREEIRSYIVGLHMVRTDRELLQNSCPVQQQVMTPFRSVVDAINWLAMNWDNRDRVSEWLHRVVGRRIGFRIAGYQLFVEAANDLGSLHPIMNEGSGLRQLIWPFAALAAADPGNVVAIEEPEILLHPQAQARLCELFVEVVRTEGKKLLLTTHSEHILIGFLTAIAKGDLKPENLAIYYLSATPDGTALAERLPIDDKGMVEGGLKGFFEAGLEELERYLEALSRQPSHEA